MHLPWTKKSDYHNDNDIELMGFKFQEMLESYKIESKLTTVKNPMAIAIVECIHSTLGEQLEALIFDTD
jgi:hypothetical protein